MKYAMRVELVEELEDGSERVVTYLGLHNMSLTEMAYRAHERLLDTIRVEKAQNREQS